MKRIILLFFLVVLLSCGVQKNTVAPKNSVSFFPELNQIRNSEIGVTLTSKEIGFMYDAIEITKAFEIKYDNLLENIEEGQIFINEYSTKNYNLYSNHYNLNYGIAIAKEGNSTLIFTINNSDGIYQTSFSQSGINFIEPNDEIEFNYTKVKAKKKDYFKQEFIYNGRIANSLKFIYREYINDYARPAFSQDIQYDLSESNIIGFQGLRIKIINASNTNIEYMVLDHFAK
ncbi:hypothetical protein [Gaetbulibacter jejuensis]|uniref:Uncharacterized protein n=1 Tax=Gaetbulibacter jejuensis TaxID=584607 RepID=A0ABP3V2S9_9FLAO